MDVFYEISRTMKRIINICQLKPGDKIFTVNPDGSHEILEFREIHPHDNGYSLFLNENKDGMHKFYNKTLEDKEYYLYDDSDECWKFIYEREIAEHKRLIGSIEERMTKLPSKPASLDSIAPYWDEKRKGVVIPLIGKVLHAKCLGEADWEGAKKLAKEAGGELFSKKEGNILAYYKDEINELLEAHGGDTLDGWNWCGSERLVLCAWFVNFSGGCIGNYGDKCDTYFVRAVSAL